MSAMHGNFVIIGLGRLGMCLLKSLTERGAAVMVIDCDEAKIQSARDTATEAIKADALNAELLEEVLPEGTECVIIDMGQAPLERSILIANYVKKLGIAQIVVHAAGPEHAEILQLVGATKVVFPEKEAAERLAGVLAGRGRLDFFPVSREFSVVEMPAPRTWIGTSLGELNVRQTHRVNVVAIRTAGDEEHWRFADPDYACAVTDVVLIAGKTEDVEKLTS